MKRAIKYIIILLIAAVGIYNLINWFGQTSALPLYYAIESFCLCGFLALHKEDSKCEVL